MAINRLNPDYPDAGMRQLLPSSVTVGSGSSTVNGNGSVNFSGASSVSLNGCFTSTYDNYKVLVNLKTSTTASVFARMRASGTDVSANYRNQRLWSFGSTVGGSSSTTDTGINGNFNVQPATEYGDFNMEITSPNLTETTRILSIWTCNNAQETNFINSALADSTQYDGISVITSSGTITGSVSIYGYRN